MSKIHGSAHPAWEKPKAAPKAETQVARNRVAGPKSEPAPAPARPAAKASPVKDGGHEKIQVGSYNVAGGNSTFGPNFKDRTSNLVADKMVRGVDVMSLQEVAINTANSGPLDYNREIMKDIFAQTHGLADKDVKSYYYDEQNQRHRIHDADSQAAALHADRWSYEGGGHSMELNVEQFDKDGNPQPFQAGGHGEHGITAYRAQLDNGDEYNSVFVDAGSKSKGGQYGDAVLLGPGMSFRDEHGEVIPGSLKATQLGTDPELWKNKDDREQRTAVGVRFNTPGGQSATAFSAHLTTESLNQDKAEALVDAGRSPEQVRTWQAELPDDVLRAQRGQMLNLEAFAENFGGDRNLFVGGDFNQRDLSKVETGSNLLHENDRIHAFDHLLTSAETNLENQHSEKGEHNFWGFLPWVDQPQYSDHDMLLADITV